MWEYKILHIKYRMHQELIDELNKEGTENWEVIYFKEEEMENKYSSKINVTILLKRQKNQHAK